MLQSTHLPLLQLANKFDILSMYEFPPLEGFSHFPPSSLPSTSFGSMWTKCQDTQPGPFQSPALPETADIQQHIFRASLHLTTALSSTNKTFMLSEVRLTVLWLVPRRGIWNSELCLKDYSFISLSWISGCGGELAAMFRSCFSCWSVSTGFSSFFLFTSF